MKRFISLGLPLLLSAVCAPAQDITFTTDTSITTTQSWSTPRFFISNGATLTIQGSDTNVTSRTSAGSGTKGIIGSATSGHLIISEGGTFTHGNAVIAENSGHTGSATITGAGSSWTHEALFVGEMGSGSLTLSDGASMSSTTAYFGAFSSGAIGTGLIDGATWTNAGSLTVGSSGTASLTISGGSTVSSKNAWLGDSASGNGSVLVTGAGSTWSNEDIKVGDDGTGTLTLANGGTVAVNSGAGTMTLGANNSEAHGTVNFGAASDAAAAVAGVLNATTVTVGAGTGTLQFNTTGTSATPTYFTKNGTSSGAGIGTSGNLSLVHTAGTTIASGTLAHTGSTTLSGGTLVIDGSVTSSAFTVNSGGTLAGRGTIGGHATFGSGAHLAPGNSPGTLTFANGLTLLSGTVVDFELGTLSDLIRVSGGTLTGPGATGGITLNLSDAGGFTAGTYTLFDFTGASTSSFDLADFAIGTAIPGFDYGFAFNGSTLELTAATSAVPEPSTYAAIFGAAALGFAAWRRRRRIG